MLTKDQMEELTKLISNIHHQARITNIHEPQLIATVNLLATLSLHVKQLQQEVLSLGQQLLDLRYGTRS